MQTPILQPHFELSLVVFVTLTTDYYMIKFHCLFPKKKNTTYLLDIITVPNVKKLKYIDLFTFKQISRQLPIKTSILIEVFGREKISPTQYVYQ